MKNLLLYLGVFLIGICGGCSSETLYESPSSGLKASSAEFQSASSSSDSTRSTAPDVVLNDRDYEVVKADLIGALEGALDGLEYAVDHGIYGDEMIGIIVIHAIINSVTRSHMAYMSFDTEYHTIFCTPGTPNSTYLGKLHYDMVRLAVSTEVKSSQWMKALIFPAKDELMINAIKVGQYHNAMLEVIDNLKSFNSLNSYETSLLSYSPTNVAFLQSVEFANSFVRISKDPINFQAYYNVDSEDVKKELKLSMGAFLNQFNRNVKVFSDYEYILNDYKNQLESSSFSSAEKEALMIGAVVGNYSLYYWLNRRVNP